MKLLFSLLLSSLLLLIGCGGTDFEKFQIEAVALAANDNKIDEKEYYSLVEKIKASSDKGLARFVGANHEVDTPKLVDYLVKLFAAKKLPLIAADIWQPGIQSPSVAKFNIDVYIENSASMDGYVKGVTEFETAIYNLLGDFKISELCESLNLNYINRDITFTKTNALAPDIQDFIEKLEPSTFKQRGGDRSTSDLKNILETVIKKVDERNAAVLISDFVFSPGSKTDAQDYLNNQAIGIKIAFAEKLKKFDMTAVVIQLQSNFDGKYYDKTNKEIKLTTKRPYYVWIFGSDAQIKAILDKKVIENIKGGYLNRVIFYSLKEPTPLEHKILFRPRVGEFELSDGAKGEITSAAVSRDEATKGVFGFNVAVNFPGAIQDANYFLDAANYRLSNDQYTLMVEPLTGKDPATQGFTHLLKLQTKELRDEVLKIEVVGKIPMWVKNSSSVDDSMIAGDDNEKRKTFGLKHLIDGVNDAFYPQSSANTMNTLSVSIKK